MACGLFLVAMAAPAAARLEVETALEAGRPVFAFLVDGDQPWSTSREQDKLFEATTDEALIWHTSHDVER